MTIISSDSLPVLQTNDNNVQLLGVEDFQKTRQNGSHGD